MSIAIRRKKILDYVLSPRDADKLSVMKTSINEVLSEYKDLQINLYAPSVISKLTDDIAIKIFESLVNNDAS